MSHALDCRDLLLNSIHDLIFSFYIVWEPLSTGTPPVTLFFGPGKICHVTGKTVLKEDRFSTKWENKANKALKNACVIGGAPVCTFNLYLVAFNFFQIYENFLMNQVSIFVLLF